MYTSGRELRDNSRREGNLNQIAEGGNYQINECAPNEIITELVVPDGRGYKPFKFCLYLHGTTAIMEKIVSYVTNKRECWVVGTLFVLLR